MSEKALPSLDPVEVRNRVMAGLSWFHRFEIVPGVMTPGTRDCAALLGLLEKIGLPAHAGGQRVADIGCRDGFFSFEMQRRGAEVVAIDRSPLGRNGFELARELMGSSVPHHVDNVYHVTPERYGLFDTLLFLGVLYHLRNPLMALDRIRGILKPGGLLFLETLLLDGTLLQDSQKFQPKPLPDAFCKGGFMQIYPAGAINGDLSNVWVPNMTGLKVMLETAQFEVIAEIEIPGRALVCARAIEDRKKEWFQRTDYETHVYDSRA